MVLTSLYVQVSVSVFYSILRCRRCFSILLLINKTNLSSCSTLSSFWTWGFIDCMFLSCHVRVSEWIHTLMRFSILGCSYFFFKNCSDFALIGVDLFKHWKQPPEVLLKKGFLEISQENTCARVSFSIKLQAESSTLLKKRIWDRCFPVNFVKYLGTLFYRTPPGDYFWTIGNSHLL